MSSAAPRRYVASDSLTTHPHETAHFSENYGFVSISPLFGGNIFSIMFGRNLDSHDSGDDLPASNSTLLSAALSAAASLASPTGTGAVATASPLPLEARGGIPSAHRCIIGRACYVDSIKVTIAATIVALALGIYASWRALQKHRKWASRSQGGPAVVIWETAD